MNSHELFLVLADRDKTKAEKIMKSIPTVKSHFNLLLSLHSAFRPLDFSEKYTKEYGDFYKFKLKNKPSIIVVSIPRRSPEL